MAIIETLPDYAHIGLVSFDKNVFVHELAPEDFLTEKALNGEQIYDCEKIAGLLGFKTMSKDAVGAKIGQPSAALLRLVAPLERGREHFRRVLNSLKVNKWPRRKGERFLRCTGAAVSVAVAIGQGFYSTGCNIIGFFGGPCTHGPGKMADLKMEILMRSHADLENDSAKIKMHTDAKKFYQVLLDRAISNNVSLAAFAFSLDQNGFSEMRDLVLKTGNMSAMHEQFSAQVFKDSVQRVFSVDESGNGYMNSGARIDMSMSKS